MANYSISDTTLTALGDAVRKHAGETREEIVPFENPINISYNSLTDGIEGFDSDDSYYMKRFVYTVEGMTSVKVVYSVDKYNAYTISVEGVAFDEVYNNIITLPNAAENVEVTGAAKGKFKVNFDFSRVMYDHPDLPADPYKKIIVNIDIYCYDADGNLITTQPTIVKNTMTPMQMVEKINGLVGVPEEALNITGACSYRFAYGGWDWFINNFGSKITTSDIGSAINMFSETTVETIPFELNFNSKSTSHNLSYIFYDTENLKEIPKINNAIPGDTSNFINKCLSIRYLPEDIGDWFDWSYMEKQTSTYGASKANMFTNCYSLRKVPMGLLNRANRNAGYNYSYFYYGFQSCHSLDELVGLPIPYTAVAWTSNAFYNTFNNCYRLKELTFALQEDGTPYKVKWKSQKIDLGANRYIGYIGSATYKKYILDYNSGITADKEVIDDATYQALKDDPDWFVSTKPAYCRYNKQSAINTLNSLPDASEYLATAGGTNTIILPKGVGGSTDGGNTSDLTEEDIAVATAKGWTVSFY